MIQAEQVDDGLIAIHIADGNVSATLVETEAEIEKFWSDLGRLLNKMEEGE